MTSTNTTALRAEAAKHLQDAEASHERCDTDGALSQWAHGASAMRLQAEADLADNNGKRRKTALFDLDGKPVNAKLIDGKYGLCWALMGDDDSFTGEFVSSTQKQATYERKGYRVGVLLRSVRCEYFAAFTGAAGQMLHHTTDRVAEAEVVHTGAGLTHLDEVHDIVWSAR